MACLTCLRVPSICGVQVMEKAALKQVDMAPRVKQERQIMALLGKNNPYVISLYFAFRTREHLFFVMEYVPGGEVAAVLKAKGTLDERESQSSSKHSRRWTHWTKRVVVRERDGGPLTDGM